MNLSSQLLFPQTFPTQLPKMFSCTKKHHFKRVSYKEWLFKDGYVYSAGTYERLQEIYVYFFWPTVNISPLCALNEWQF